MKKFVHLHCHSHYSLLDGASKIPDLARHVAGLGMPAVAITDHGNMYGFVEFMNACKAAGVKPIAGIEAYVAPQSRFDKKQINGESSYHLTLLARDGAGVRNLWRLSSLAFLEGYYYKPRIDKEILERHSEGIICLSGCASGELSDLLLAGRDREARALAEWYSRVFGENFYMEVQDNGVQIQKDCLVPTMDLARSMGLPVVASSDAHYLRREDSRPHDILLCINTKSTLRDPKRMKFDTDQFHVCSHDEIWDRMGADHDSEVAEAIGRSAEIAEGVEEGYASLGFGKRQFPSFPTPGTTPEGRLGELCREALARKYGGRDDARERMEHELAIICKMGFAPYMLVVWDVVRSCREAGIPVAARGSACGAIVSYLLDISNFCPIEHGLLFERFLDPSRSDPPDIDLDLCKSRRQEVIEYVRAKYGKANVAHIATFGTLGPKAAMKDVARVLGVDYGRVGEATALIPGKLGTTLAGTIEGVPEFLAAVRGDVGLTSTLEYALTIEGTARSAGTHAAGVVIGPKPLIDLVPLQRSTSKDKKKTVVDSMPATQWTMGDIEKAGLLKMDFLGLRNMTMLASLKEMTGIRDFFELPIDDAETFAMLRRGESRGVFQLDAPEITSLLKRIKPDRFGDIVAVLALYRPGPIEGGMIDEYIDVKHGRKPAKYLHAVMEEILEPTYGVITYQEQVMMILNRLAGIELTRAYQCIKMISKKKPVEVAKFGGEFIVGAADKIGTAAAQGIWELINVFAGYAFNKSHATAYGYLAYQTAYLKCHYPTEFMAALLSSEMDGAEREKYLAEHINDCRRMGIEILPPDINASGVEFRPDHPKEGGGIRFGLGAIKGVAVDEVRKIVAARDPSPFGSLQDMIERTRMEAPRVEPLIRVGAFDSLGPRGAHLALLPRLVRGAKRERKDAARGQAWLFDEPMQAVPLPHVEDLSAAQKSADEMKILGFYLQASPMVEWGPRLARFARHRANELRPGPAVLAGMASGVEFKSIKTGLMLKFQLDDGSGIVPCVAWPNIVDDFKLFHMNDGWVGVVAGKVESYKDKIQVIVNKMVPADRAESMLARGVVARVGCVLAAERLRRVAKLHPGPLPLALELPGGTRASAGALYRVGIDGGLIGALEAIVGAGNAWVQS